MATLHGETTQRLNRYTISVRGYDLQDAQRVEVRAYKQSTILCNIYQIPNKKLVSDIPHLKHLQQEIPPEMDIPSGILIGVDCDTALAPREVILREEGETFAMHTVFGWTLCGEVKKLPTKHRVNNETLLPNNRAQAEKRFEQLANKLKGDATYKEEYDQFMREMIDNGHAELAPDEPVTGKTWYIPHFGEYRMTRHLFGATPSPGVATFALQKIAKEYEEENPIASNLILENFYVDDGIKSVDTVEEAANLVQNAIEICGRANLRLHKFLTNNREVLANIPASERVKEAQNLDLFRDKPPTGRTLGLEWSVENDTIQFQNSMKAMPSTRRGILLVISQLYDPLGLLAPFILKGRQISQKACGEKGEWDAEVSPELKSDWENWKKELSRLESVKLERCVVPKEFGCVTQTEIHHFCDASLNGYGACSYVRLENPADILSRDASLLELRQSTWWSGPEFLRNLDIAVYLDDKTGNETTAVNDPEIKKPKKILCTSINVDSLAPCFERFSSWLRMVKAIANARKMLSARSLSKPELLPADSLQVEIIIIKLAQSQEWSADIKRLSKSEEVHKGSSLLNLRPYLDEDGLLHVGLTTTVGAIRGSGYWITGASKLVGSVIHKCVQCQAARGLPITQLMGDSPQTRVEPSPPFTHAGVDCFGSHTVEDSWGLLITCMYSRVVHIEIFEAMSADSFINAIRRFICVRRGIKTIYSDNGTNFVGGVNELTKEFETMNCTLKAALKDEMIEFKFNVSNASQPGGAWERLVQTIKGVLNGMITTYKGDLVLIVDDLQPHNQWLTAIAEYTINEKSELPKRAKARVASRYLDKSGKRLEKATILERPIQKLIQLLPSESE
ncbi:uncharacterized protein [Watersipora subatra]|uniref:uncharacterized protein n=1 Tax=Watersipora subatra TaxID=2589382 RepID=UPI00355B1979